MLLSDLIASIYLANYKDTYQSHEYFIYPHFILHFLYITPIVYYLTKPLSPFVENKKNKINSIKKYIFIFFNDMSKIYLPVLILSITSLLGIIISDKKSKKLNYLLLIYLVNVIIFSCFFILPRYKLIILPMQLIFTNILISFIYKKFFNRQ